MQRIYILSVCISVLFVSQTLIAKINWSRYTPAQLLMQKEKAKNDPEVLRQIEQELARLGIVATVTLAQAPTGKEWVLQEKNLILEKKEGGPETPPPGAGDGQWFFVAPNWLYFEKNSGSILDSSGKVMGKIGAIDLASPSADLVALTAREAQTKTLMEELQARIKKLEEQKGVSVKPAAPEAPPLDIPGAPETAPAEGPEAPPLAPEAPGFEGPGEVPFVPSSPKAGKGPLPLTVQEMNELTSEQKNSSDQLFVAAIKNVTTLFDQNVDTDSYGALIKKELELLRTNKNFYKRAELDELIKNGITDCFQDKTVRSIDASSIITCLKTKCIACLFDVSTGATFEHDIQTIVDVMIVASDELFKDFIKKCTKTFPKEITSQSYSKMLQDALKDLKDKNKNFYKKGNHTFALTQLIRDLQDIDYDPETPESYLISFNEQKESYFDVWLDECKKCLFNTTVDADFENDVRWIISYVVAAGRGERDIKERINSQAAQGISDFAIQNLFIESNPETATVEDTWLPALRTMLTDPAFLKPYGLMISYGADTSFSAKAINQPIMQILVQPVSKVVREPSLAFINSVVAYLSFNGDQVKQNMTQHKTIINQILSKPRREILAKKPPVEKTPQTLKDYFATNAFAGKTLVEIIQMLDKIKAKSDALVNAIRIMKSEPQDQKAITQLLASAGLSQSQVIDIDATLIKSQKPIELLNYLLQHVQEYEKNVKKNPGYKNGKQLYQFVKEQIKNPQLIKAFERIDRESDMLYSALTNYLKAVPNTFTRTVPSSRFRKTIEPYGILISILKAFNAQMEEADPKAFAKLINALTALNTGKLSTGTEYPDIVNESKDAIENQQLYVGQLQSALDALKHHDFTQFIAAVDAFVAQAGTIAQKLPDDSVQRTSEYEQIIEKFKQFEGTLLLNDIKATIDAINKGNYTALPGFEGASLPVLQARAALVGSLTPLVRLLEKAKTIDVNTYKKAYEELINGREFLRKSNILPATKDLLKSSLLKVLAQTAERLEGVKQLKVLVATPVESQPAPVSAPDTSSSGYEVPEAPAFEPLD